MRVRKGPMLQKFAALIDEEDVEEVVEWVNTYINGPWSEERMKLLEATEEDRAASIKDYIRMRVESSATHRIKQQIEAAKTSQEKS